MSAVLVLTTMSASEDAGALARTLVEERLAACVNVLPPMQSTYRWRDQIEVEPERQLVIKTSQDRVIDLQNRLVALHPYEVPEFLVIAVTGGTEAYLTWLREQTQPDAS